LGLRPDAQHLDPVEPLDQFLAHQRVTDLGDLETDGGQRIGRGGMDVLEQEGARWRRR
jgi:hypothetical protein